MCIGISRIYVVKIIHEDIRGACGSTCIRGYQGVHVAQLMQRVTKGACGSTCA